MPKDGSQTRTRILDAAEGLMLQQGYAGTSVDRLIEAAGITKGTFFYHFENKRALAQALVSRWVERDIEYLEVNLERSEKLARDPLQRLLIFVGLFIEAFDRPVDAPGCLYASFCYEADLMDGEMTQAVRGAFDRWRTRLVPLLEEIATQYPPQMAVDPAELVDMLGVVFEGTFIMSRIHDDAGMISRHLTHYRNYLELLFASR